MSVSVHLRLIGGILLLAALPVLAGKAYVNQLGFPPGAAKQAVYVDAAGGATLTLRRPADPSTIVKTLTPTAAKVWQPSGESASLLDFSDITAAGTYAIYENGTRISPSFPIVADAYQDLLKGLLKWYYYQRASTALPTQYAGDWARSAGHPDTLVRIHSSAGSGMISSPKGWYDAGDYGKYIVNSGITMASLLDLYQHYSGLFTNLKWNIPESENNVPDLLDEIRWNLDWMLTMQDGDGGVYHKLTTLQFSGSVMPSADKAARYVMMKTTAASYDFAAVMAMAARIYASVDAGLANDCRYAAVRAFAWAEEHPNAYYVQPGDVGTGEYGDRSLSDERLWAAVSMALIDTNSLYMNVLDLLTSTGNWPSGAAAWPSVGTLGTFEVARHPEVFGAEKTAAAREKLLESARSLLGTAQSSGFGLSITSSNFVWGSNSVVANQAIILLYGYYLTDEKPFLNAAQAALDYILGRNPMNMSYVTGFGTSSPMDPHHRPSEADGKTAPVPGMVAGGPHTGGQDVGSNSWECSNYVVPGRPALSYIDNRCSYATNEVAINWNAAVSYLAGAIHALSKGYSKPSAEAPPETPSVIHASFQNQPRNESIRLHFDGTGIRLHKVLRDGSEQRYHLTGQRIK